MAWSSGILFRSRALDQENPRMAQPEVQTHPENSSLWPTRVQLSPEAATWGSGGILTCIGYVRPSRSLPRPQNCRLSLLPKGCFLKPQDPPPAPVWGKKGWAAFAHGCEHLSFPRWAQNTRDGQEAVLLGPHSPSEKRNGITTGSGNSRQQNQTAKPRHASGWAMKQRRRQCTRNLAGLMVFRNHNCSEQLLIIYMWQVEGWFNFSVWFPGEAWGPLGRR